MIKHAWSKFDSGRPMLVVTVPNDVLYHQQVCAIHIATQTDVSSYSYEFSHVDDKHGLTHRVYKPCDGAKYKAYKIALHKGKVWVDTVQPHITKPRVFVFDNMSFDKDIATSFTYDGRVYSANPADVLELIDKYPEGQTISLVTTVIK